jgi:FkbM family methyltransferase
MTLQGKRLPGRGFIKNFFRVHGPVRTLKGMYFYYYSQFRMRNLSFDPKEDAVVNVNEYKMQIIPTDKGISAELAMFNSHEPLTTKVLASLLRKGMVCLDIGSNIGYYALLESKIVGKDGRVICVEPSPLNFQFLKKNLAMEGESELDTYNIAVGDVEGHIDFMTGGESNLCRVITYNEHDRLLSDEHKKQIIQVRIRQIDSLIKEINPHRIDFIRMDPEGYEHSIYRGMKDTVQRFKPMLLIEFHINYLGITGTRKLLEDLKNDGYESLHYIPRWMDNPIISNNKYIQSISIGDLLVKLDKDSLPAGFNIFLANTNPNHLDAKKLS